jgi:SAM-dependent methyltransferase
MWRLRGSRCEQMKDYYEELWARLPDELARPDLELRRGFLLRELRAGDIVLDLGSGAGDFTAEIATVATRAVGVEVAEAALARARTRHPAVDFRLAPADGPLPFADGEFSMVWASEVIEHVGDTARWLWEVRRVLAPAGRLLLTTPSHGRLRLLLGGVERFSEPLGDHLHLYSRDSLRSTLASLGFNQISVRAVGGPPLLRRVLLARAVT